MKVPQNIEQWAKAVAAAFITGCATSFLSALGVTGAQMVGVKIDQLTPKQLFVTTVFGGLVGVAAYLKTSPVPPEPKP